MANMFKYKIFCGDYSLAGYSEDLMYSGTDREEALKAYREAKDWLDMVRVEINVLGREKHLRNRTGIVDFEDDKFDHNLRDSQHIADSFLYIHA